MFFKIVAIVFACVASSHGLPNSLVQFVNVQTRQTDCVATFVSKIYLLTTMDCMAKVFYDQKLYARLVNHQHTVLLADGTVFGPTRIPHTRALMTKAPDTGREAVLLLIILPDQISRNVDVMKLSTCTVHQIPPGFTIAKSIQGRVLTDREVIPSGAIHNRHDRFADDKIEVTQRRRIADGGGEESPPKVTAISGSPYFTLDGANPTTSTLYAVRVGEEHDGQEHTFFPICQQTDVHFKGQHMTMQEALIVSYSPPRTAAH